jgi:hypothetical protein
MFWHNYVAGRNAGSPVFRVPAYDIIKKLDIILVGRVDLHHGNI